MSHPERENGQRREPRGSYWSRNLKRLGVLLSIWFLGSFGVSILLVDEFDKISLFGFKLGFWFAQQGSIYLFLVLILAYVRMMNSLDDEYDESSGHDDREDV